MALLLTRSDVEQLLDLGACMDALRTAHVAFSSGGAVMPLRLTARFHEHGIMALMPAWLDDGPQLGVKCATSFFANPARGLPLIASTVLLLDPETGALRAVMDGSRITEIRTAAASAVATAELARADASRLALIGAGAQARAHLDAMAAVRDVASVTVVARTRESAERFVADAERRYPDIRFVAEDNPDDAVRSADLVCAVSTAREPVVNAGAVAPGTHVNGVGSHTPGTREVSGETMRVARVIVDSRDANLNECGDCMIPIADGLFGPEHVSDELGELLAGQKAGRTSADEITVYQSCGIAIQDLAAASVVYERALEGRVGIEIDL